MTAKLSSLLKGLVFHAPLDQESYNPATKRFTDQSAYGNHGTAANAGSFVADRMGQSSRATSFNGTSDFVDCGAGESLNITDEITISAWVKPNIGANTCYILSKNSLGVIDHQYALHWNSVNKFVKGHINAEQCGNSVVDSVFTGQWTHVLMQYNKTDVRYYINDVLSGNAYPKTGGITPTASTVNIGRRKPNNLHFDGSITDVRIYNRVLTDAERTLLYESYRPRLIIQN